MNYYDFLRKQRILELEFQADLKYERYMFVSKCQTELDILSFIHKQQQEKFLRHQLKQRDIWLNKFSKLKKFSNDTEISQLKIDPLPFYREPVTEEILANTELLQIPLKTSIIEQKQKVIDYLKRSEQLLIAGNDLCNDCLRNLTKRRYIDMSESDNEIDY